MAAKAHLRNNRPLVLSIATNDGLGANGKNITTLINTKNVYIVPFGQDSFKGKPNSLVSNLDYLEDTIEGALLKKQTQPIFLTYDINK